VGGQRLGTRKVVEEEDKNAWFRPMASGLSKRKE
jgi:hypothetical protein